MGLFLVKILQMHSKVSKRQNACFACNRFQFQLLAFVHHGKLRKIEHNTKDREPHLVPVLQERGTPK